MLLVDAGPLFALLDTADDDHERCRDLLENAQGPLIVPQLVISEVAHLTKRSRTVETEVRLCGSFASGEFLTEPVAPADWMRIAELVHRYADLRLGTVDASVVAAAERLGATTIATLDRRDFGAVRPKHVDAFTLLP